MKKKIRFIIFALLLCIPFSIKALFDAVIINYSTNIRSGPGTNYSILYTLSPGTSISVVDKQLYEGNGCSEKWYKINYKSKTAYVCSKYVKFVDSSFSGINVSDWTARVNANNIYTRKSATTSSDKVNTLSLGTNVTVLSSVNKNNSGCSSNVWYKIKYYGTKTAYICSKYVTFKSNITAYDEEYTTTLRELGFPDSYIPYLTYMHNNHPNWVFKPKTTKKNFAITVDGEEGLNYMQTTNSNYITSTTPAEGSTWYKVNSGVIAFYLDPRNWLTDSRVFMFEKLDYEDSYDELYPELIKSVFGNGLLSNDIYTVPMYTKGKQYSVSPLHIASRIRLEVGINGSDSTNGTSFTYKGKTYSGYYNFFNIGAYEKTIDGVTYSAITMGLVHAMNKGWNTIEKSIAGGVSFLANGYINAGQGTLYYQKFNVSTDSPGNNCTHQYQTNIQAPATEGNQNYNSYKSSGILNQQFIFEIPVYSNMPDYTSLPDYGDTNNYLSSLQVDSYSLSPAFDKDILTYEIYIPSDVNKINITATAESAKAIVSGTGEIDVIENTTDITITVKSETNEERKYIITVNKVTDNNNDDDNGNTNNDNNGPDEGSTNQNNDPVVTSFESILSNSSLTIKNNIITNVKYNTTTTSIQNKLIKANAKSVVFKTKDGKKITSNSKIATGYTVTITNEVESKTYTFSIKGDTSGDGKIDLIDLLQIRKHITGDKKLTGVYSMAADTSSDNKVTIVDLLQVRKHITGDKKL